MSRITVHWTSHACLDVDPNAERPELAGFDYWNEPVWIGGRHHRPLLATRNRYSVDLDEVTCESCRATLEMREENNARPVDKRAGKYVDTFGLHLAAHRACCAARGAPLFADPEDVRDYERWEVSNALRPMLVAGCHANSVADLVGVTATLPAWLQSPLRPAIDELVQAVEFIVVAEQMRARALQVVADVIARVRDGEIEMDRTEALELVRTHQDRSVERLMRNLKASLGMTVTAERPPEPIADAQLSTRSAA